MTEKNPYFYFFRIARVPDATPCEVYVAFVRKTDFERFRNILAKTWPKCKGTWRDITEVHDSTRFKGKSYHELRHALGL